MKTLLAIAMVGAMIPAALAQGMKIECNDGKCKVSGPPYEVAGGADELLRLRNGVGLSCEDKTKDVVITRTATGILISCEPAIIPEP